MGGNEGGAFVNMPMSHVGGEALASGRQLGSRQKEGDREVKAPRQELGPLAPKEG